MKILFDHQTFVEQEFGGISRYYYELITRLSGRKDVNVDHSIKYSNNEYLKNNDQFKLKPYFGSKRFVTDDYFVGKNRLFRLFKFLKLIPDHSLEMEKIIQEKLMAGDFDIFHPTYYNPYYLDWAFKAGTPVVLTVYDLIHEKFPKYFPKTEKFKRNKKICIESANRIIAISENTKKDLMEYYNIPEDRVDVISLGSSLDSETTDNKFSEGLNNGILYVGNRSTYKNFLFLLESILPLFKEFHELKIILAGGEKISDSERKFFKSNQIEERIIVQSIQNNADLITLYRSCRLFVFPSIYEGFGIPLLEAMQNGSPVVCSNTSSFPEVAGDAANFFNPLDRDSILGSVREVYNNENLRTDLIKKGFTQSQKFNWENTAEKTIETYRKSYEEKNIPQ